MLYKKKLIQNHKKMKLKIQYIIAFLIIGSIFGCKEDPALFKESDGLYFGTADTTLSYSFAKYPKKVKDIIEIPVNVLGNSTNASRSFNVEVVPGTGDGIAVEGTHFKVLGNLNIPANAVVGKVSVEVYRTADLDAGKAVKFTIRLKRDEHFPAEAITAKQKLTINLAYLQKPASWGELNGTVTGFWAGFNTNFGTWTPTKYKIILDALYDPTIGETVTEFPGSRFAGQFPTVYTQYLAIVRNYIKNNYPGNYGLPGPILTDPDNSNLPIQVGPANY